MDDDWYSSRACHLCPWSAIERDLQDTGAHDHSRHFDFGSRGGFIAPLDLPGWGWQSYWGMSDRELGFFAALWHTGRWSPVPDHPPCSAPDFQRGVADALRWLLGTNRRAPGSQKRWPRSRPRPEHADAEEHMLLGRTMDYDHLDQQGYYGGAECALWWALGRCDELYPSRAVPPEPADTPDA